MAYGMFPRRGLRSYCDQSCGCAPQNPCCCGENALQSTAGFRNISGSARAVGSYGEYIAVGADGPNIVIPPPSPAQTFFSSPVKIGLAAAAVWFLFLRK